MHNLSLKQKAVDLRKSGHTYTEILKVIPVAKSTLSEWLRSVGIAKAQFRTFTEKKRLASLRGGQARRNTRIETFNLITGLAEKEIENISDRELWLIGIALYWAEGSKEKEYAPGIGVNFSNSDPKMISLFLLWLTKICKISREKIHFEIYIHEIYIKETQRFIDFWSKNTSFSISSFDKIYYKKANIKIKRKNKNELYNGLLRVKVSCSSDLNRKIQGWTRGIIKNCQIV